MLMPSRSASPLPASASPLPASASPQLTRVAPSTLRIVRSEPRVIEIDPLADPRWDRFVLSHPLANGYHLGAWPRVLQQAYRYRPCCLALERDGELVGVMPLVHSGPRLSGARLSSLPTAKSAGPLAVDRAGATALLRASAQLRQDTRVGALNVRSSVAGLERQIDDVRVASTYPSYVLSLTAADELLEGYKRSSKNLYRSILKSQRSGLTIADASSPRELRRWYRLYLRTMRKHRSFPRSLRQFEAAMALLDPERWRLVTVSKDGQTIAGGVFHDIAGTVELLYNASDPAHLAARPNHALYWHAIRAAIERGRSAFDFGSADSQALRSFKEQWGADPVDHHAYVNGVSTPADERAPAVSASGTALAVPTGEGATVTRMAIRSKDLGGAALARAPLSASRLIGTAVHRLA